MGKVIELAEERLDGKKMEEAAIIEIDCEQDCVRLEKMIQESFNPRKIFATAVSPVVETIVGPGALGEISRKLADAEVNIELFYLATGTRLVLGVDDMEKTVKAL